MELWIRSQDKKQLFEVETIEISPSGMIILVNGRVFGTYKSEEIALEVLDELQKFLQPDFKCDGYETELQNGYYNEIKLHFSEPNIFHKRVYEMPKK